MNRKYPTIYRKIKATVLLLCLFFMMVSSCPVRNLLSSAFVPSVELSKQAKSSKQSISAEAFVYDGLHCVETQITKASLLDFSTLTNNTLPLPLFLTVISLYLSLSILSLSFRSFRIERKRTIRNPLPLFLQNRSIII